MARVQSGVPVRSPKNPRLKAARALRAGRDRSHVLLEGVHLLLEAVASKAELAWVLYDEHGIDAEEREILEGLATRGVEVRPCEEHLLRSVSDLDSPPGILAMVPRPEGDLQDLLRSTVIEQGLLLVSAGIQDPGNVGAVVRAAAGLGASGVVALVGSASPWHPRAVRGASGTTFRIPVVERLAAEDWVAAAAAAELPLWECAAAGEDVASVRRSTAAALILGEEGSGVPAELAAHCQRSVGIPLARGVESLNVATAAAILTFLLGRRA